MPRKPRIYSPFDSWPAEDQARWQAAFAEGDRFDGSGPGSHLAESTRRGLRISYGRFLTFISAKHPNLLELRPEARVDRLVVTEIRDVARQVVRIRHGGDRPRWSSSCAEIDLSWR
jgi:hypothetical protein